MLLKKGKETRVEFNPGLSVNRPLNHWVHFSSEFISKPVLPILQRKHSLISLYGMKMPAQPGYRIIIGFEQLLQGHSLVFFSGK